jgi:hypothetical protein
MPERFVYVIFAGFSVYIGRTDDVIRRMSEHKMLYCDWAILETTDSQSIRKREAHWMKHFLGLGCHVLNHDKEVNETGVLAHTEETKARIARSMTGKKFPPRSLEYRENMRIVQTGKKHSEETRAKMRASSHHSRHNKGRKMPASFSRKQSLRLIGNTYKRDSILRKQNAQFPN